MKSIKYNSEQLKCEIKIDYVVSEKYSNKDLQAFFFLDGQNAFFDDLATYGRSLRALSHLDKLRTNYIAIAIHSPNTDRDRLNMYSPFVIDTPYLNGFKNTPNICNKFISELKNVIIPSIDNKFHPKKKHLIGSSLGASLAIYINSTTKLFDTMCILSNSNFIFNDAMEKHLSNNKNCCEKLYIGVGKKEISDNIYSSEMYLTSFYEYQNYLSSINANFYAKINNLGEHNEASWEKHLRHYFKKVIAK